MNPEKLINAVSLSLPRKNATVNEVNVVIKTHYVLKYSSCYCQSHVNTLK